MIICLNMAEFPNNQWIGLRENLQETMVFTIKYGGLINIYIYIYGYGSIPINTIFRGMNIHKSQLF